MRPGLSFVFRGLVNGIDNSRRRLVQEPAQESSTVASSHGHSAAIALAVVLCAALCGCRSERSSSERPRGVPVTVASAEQRSVPVQIRGIGNIEAYSTIAVKAQVGGELTKVFFGEGEDVRKGQDLFQIDPRPYDLALKQAEAALAKDLALVKQSEANLARDIAQAEQAESEAARSAQLAAQGIISKELDDRARTAASAMLQSVAADKAALDSARTAVNADRVAIERAKLELSYCLIQSPIDGRTGPILVKEGNLVKADADTPMVTIHQIRPIYAAFAVPEGQFPSIRAKMADRPLDVEVTVPGSPIRASGRLAFVDNAVDSSTGMIRLKARFDNRDGRLWPGQFVDVTLILANEGDVTVVPSEALQNGPNGQFVYVVQSDRTVQMRPVTIGRTVDEFVVIEKGVAPGELVVTDGQLRLTPGSAVQVTGRPVSRGLPRPVVRWRHEHS